MQDELEIGKKLRILHIQSGCICAFSCRAAFSCRDDLSLFCRLALKALVKRWSGGDVIYLEDLLSPPIAGAPSSHSGCKCWHDEEEEEEEDVVVEDEFRHSVLFGAASMGIQDLVLLMSVRLRM